MSTIIRTHLNGTIQVERNDRGYSVLIRTKRAVPVCVANITDEADALDHALHLAGGCPPDEPAEVCQWFALCDRLADGTASHPILGPVPICTRCAARVGIEVTR